MFGKTISDSAELDTATEPLPGRPRLLYPVNEVAYLLGDITPRTVWALLDRGEIRSRKLGRRRLIPADALEEFIAGLPEATPAGPVAKQDRGTKPGGGSGSRPGGGGGTSPKPKPRPKPNPPQKPK